VVWCGVVWCGVVWCGVVWCGVVWCGVVWCGVVWCGVVWCGVVWCRRLDKAMTMSPSTSVTPTTKESESSFHVRQKQAPFASPVPWYLCKKPLWIVLQEIDNQQHHEHQVQQHQQHHEQQWCRRHLSLWDLISVGVGGTIGSGIFVLTGLIAHSYAGSATCLSFGIAGLAAATSGVGYAELSGRIPTSGSTYVYSYICLGESAAILAAACLTLEYSISGAAVARSWGDKVVEWFHHHHDNNYGNLRENNDDNDDTIETYLEPHGINLLGGLVSAISVALLLAGVQESKQVTNFFTITKVVLVLFMIVAGLSLFQVSNLVDTNNNNDNNDNNNGTFLFLSSLAPLGFPGILRGATSSFFGYLGYDEICCLAGEAIHPKRDMPRAVLGTLSIVTMLYMVASLALTGMLPYRDISPTSGFPAAFAARNVNWAATLCAMGEIITLPVVVWISLMAQPRLLQAMAQDGLLPKIFCQVDDKGNLQWGTLISGGVMVVVATFVPFVYVSTCIRCPLVRYFQTVAIHSLFLCSHELLTRSYTICFIQLDDLISVGILLAFSMTNSCLILLRCESPMERPRLVEKHLVALNLLCLVTGLLLSHAWTMAWGPWLAGMALLPTVGIVLSLAWRCPQSQNFGGSIGRPADIQNNNDDDDYFQTPFVPYLPCAGIFINWCLVSQLELPGLLLLLVYLGGSLTIYLYYGSGGGGGGGSSTMGSSGGHSVGWKHASYEPLPGREDDPDHWPVLHREVSLVPMALPLQSDNNHPTVPAK
jgi:amino acid transporter